MIIGAHITKKKTLFDTIQEIISKKGNALQFFSKNPRSSEAVNIERYIEDCRKIREINNNNEFKLVIHSSYTINIATPLKIDKRTVDIYDTFWFKSVIADLELAHYLNIKGTIIHVGKYTKQTPEEGLSNMKNAMKIIINYIKEKKLLSKIILETAAGQGTELLVNIDDLIEFYNKINESRYFNLCYDTCHIWSAGYDLIESYKKIQKETKNGISVIHLNGSLTVKNSRKDRHSQITEGTIPIEEMENFIRYIKNTDKEVITILETPSEKLSEEIKYIKELI